MMNQPVAVWQPLDRDTTFFGIKTARITPTRLDSLSLVQALAETREWGAEVLHLLVESDHAPSVVLAEQAGFHLVDIRVTLEWRPTDAEIDRRPAAVQVRAYEVADLLALQAIAGTSYHDTRYYYDGRYPRELCDALYAEWIAKSCGGAAEAVLVAVREQRPLGFVTCHLASTTQTGQIGLVGVDADARGSGVGEALVRAAQQWFRDRQASRVSVVTQGRNIGAQRLYQRAGFATSAVQLWYHKWFAE
jgi:ribosomal protein S18 acetylase RimI-like enzyme